MKEGIDIIGYNAGYTRQLLEMFRQHYTLARQHLEEENIHQMRVVVKKLKAIRNLRKHLDLAGNEDSHEKSLMNQIRDIYSLTGKLRDFHIQQNLLRFFKKRLQTTFSEFQQYLSDLETKTEEDIAKQLKDTEFSISLSDSESPGQSIAPSGEVSLKRSFGFITKKLNRIESMLIDEMLVNRLHELRKQIKQLFFVLQFISGQFQEVLEGYDLKPLRRIGETLGQWNDLKVFRGQLEKFLNDQPEGFLLGHPEYRILLLEVDHQLHKLVKDIDAEVYLEVLRLRKLISAQESHKSLS